MKVYDILCERIIDALNQGIIPWQRPWDGEGAFPYNFRTKRPYSGINVFLLWVSRFDHPGFLTFRQVQEMGGRVKAGEKSSPVFFWKFIEKEEEGEVKRIPCLRFYNVFNVTQTEGIPYETYTPHHHDPIPAAERVVAGMPNVPPITHKGEEAAYIPAQDAIVMPAKDRFHSAEAYYAVLFHELAHSTAHPSRLGRKHSYAYEEMIAEFASSFVCASIGLSQDIENRAAYIQHWGSVIRSNRHIIMSAASAAQKAADYILGTTPAAPADEEG